MEGNGCGKRMGRAWRRVGYACMINRFMDGDPYVKILDEELQESFKFYDKAKAVIIFQQDDDPKCTCKKAKQWFPDHEWTGLHNTQT